MKKTVFLGGEKKGQVFHYGNTGYEPLSSDIYDCLQSDACWLRPNDVVVNIIEAPRREFKPRELVKRNGHWYVRERNGREVYVGVLNIRELLIVNAKPDQTFDAMHLKIEWDGLKDPRTLVIPYADFKHGSVEQHLRDYPRIIDCPMSYVTAAFYEELRGVEAKFMQLPARAGGFLHGEHWEFVTADSIIPQLEVYYSPEIVKRKMPQTDKPLRTAAAELAAILPDYDVCRILLTANVSSVLLAFFAEANIKPDRLFIVHTDCERSAKLATVLLQNRSFSDTRICSLFESRTVLEYELDQIWDGTVVFRDSSYLEARKRRDAGIDVLLQELRRGQGINESNRRMIAVITDNPPAYSTELPAVFIDMSGCPETENLEELQQAIGAFLVALIKVLANSDATENLVTAAIKHTPLPQKTIENGGEIGAESIMRCTANLLAELNVFDRKKIPRLNELFRRGADTVCDQDLAVANEFRAVLSEMIEHGELRVANQYGQPFYSDPDAMVLLDRECVNFSTDVLNNIVTKLKATQRRNVVLRALNACGKLHANNNYKRLIDVSPASGVVETLSFYSVPRLMLTPSCQAKLNGVRFADCLFKQGDFPECFVPIMRAENNLVADRVIDDTTDEAESIFVSGRTRAGKSFWLVQQAVIRAAAGNRVLIFDQTGAFLREELHKHLPMSIIAVYFTFWEIGVQGLPIDLLSLDNCRSLPDKKQRLAGIFSVLARLTGEVQLKVLRSRLARMAREIESGMVHGLSDILRFFEEDDPDQAEIRERLEEAFEDLEGLPESQMTWGDFLDSQGKIIVISTASDGIRKSSQFIDAMLASLYAWKQHNRADRLTVVLDEIEDLSLEKDGSVSTILRKGGKHRLSMMLATQEYSAEKDRLGKLIGNCGLQLIFRPKEANIDSIAKHIGVSRQQLAALEQGEFVACGGFYSRSKARNCKETLWGRAFTAADLLVPDEPVEAEEIPADDPGQTAVLQPDAIQPEPWARTDFPLVLPESVPELPVQVEPIHPAKELQSAESPEAAPETTIPEKADTDPVKPEKPDVPEENPQEIIERELQQQFQRMMRSFTPDYPNWTAYLADLFGQIMERHYFASQSDRDFLQYQLEIFAMIDPDTFDYRKQLEKLYQEIWPNI